MTLSLLILLAIMTSSHLTHLIHELSLWNSSYRTIFSKPVFLHPFNLFICDFIAVPLYLLLHCFVLFCFLMKYLKDP